MSSYKSSRIRVNDVDLAYYEWGLPANPTVLFLHATGFHARCWFRVIERLPPNTHALAIDFRGHGHSANVPPFEWCTFGDDVLAFLAALDLRVAVVVGHSMGGHAAVYAAATAPDRLSSALLIDPVIQSPDLYEEGLSHRQFTEDEEHPVARRRQYWESPDQLFDRLKDRHPFVLWQPAVLRDYCQYGLVPVTGGSYELACPPLVEAAIYQADEGRNIAHLFDRVTQPVVVLRARFDPPPGTAMDFSQSPTWPELATHFVQGQDVYLPNLTHFIPMQDPELVSRWIQRLLTQAERS